MQVSGAKASLGREGKRAWNPFISAESRCSQTRMRTALRLGSLGNVPDGNAGPGAQLQRLKAAGRARTQRRNLLLRFSLFFNLEIPTFALRSQAGGGAPPPLMTPGMTPDP